MKTWIRPGERPEYGRTDVEWWWGVDDQDGWRIVTPDEAGRTCSQRGCVNEAVAVIVDEVGGWGKRRRYSRRRFCCPEHLYGRVVEDGRVLALRPRWPEEARS
jgi:hypothetical protein